MNCTYVDFFPYGLLNVLNASVWLQQYIYIQCNIISITMAAVMYFHCNHHGNSNTISFQSSSQNIVIKLNSQNLLSPVKCSLKPS